MRIAPLLALILAGCALNPPTPRPALADDPSYQCLKAIPADPQLTGLARHISLADAREVSVEMLADQGAPTEGERQAISLWAHKRADCVTLGRDFRARYFTILVPLYEKANAETMQLTAQLYAGRITYGQFNGSRQQNALQAQRDAMDLARATQRDLTAQQQRQQAMTSQALADMAAALQMMQPIRTYPGTPPVFCTSTRSGAAVNTLCQ